MPAKVWQRVSCNNSPSFLCSRSIAFNTKSPPRSFLFFMTRQTRGRFSQKLVELGCLERLDQMMLETGGATARIVRVASKPAHRNRVDWFSHFHTREQIPPGTVRKPNVAQQDFDFSVCPQCERSIHKGPRGDD